jgi:hypothetical protein
MRGIRPSTFARKRIPSVPVKDNFNAAACNRPSTVTARKGAISVGQDGILRGDWQSPRVPVANRHAACQAAPQKHNFARV